MREIKFRAWLTLSEYDDDGNYKDYYGMATRISVYYDGSIGFHVEHGHDIFGGDIFDRAMDNGTVCVYEEWCMWEGHCNLMQYTGLRDKNGVEIYEGDILQYVSPEPQEEDVPDRYVVEWVGFGWEATWQHAHKPSYVSDGRMSLQGCDEDMEVIGNIYENPELLNGGGE